MATAREIAVLPLASLLAEESFALTVPCSLIQATQKLKNLFLLGGSAGTNSLAVVLARGAMRAMLLAKIIGAVVVIASVGLLIVGSSAAMYGSLGGHRPTNQQSEGTRPGAS